MKAKVVSNLEELSSIIGTFQGISDAANDEEFMQEILVDANKRVLERFNIMAAERTKRMKGLNRSFKHMYEFGVAGISEGKTVISDPTSQAARLWVFTPVAAGRTVNTTVTFRDAVVPNPKPAERKDLKRNNVSKDIIDRMSNRDYVFRRRAEMVEYGKTVMITPKYAKALIFPSRENESGVGFWPRSAGPMRINLGGEDKTGRKNHQMAFTNYFMGWWSQFGEDQARESAHQSFAARIGHARRARKKQKSLKPAGATNIPGAAKKAKSDAIKAMKRGGKV